MKAIWYDQTGPAREVLQYGDLPTPAPGQGQALIRIKASGVNPSDVGMRGGPAPMAYRRITPNSEPKIMAITNAPKNTMKCHFNPVNIICNHVTSSAAALYEPPML